LLSCAAFLLVDEALDLSVLADSHLLGPLVRVFAWSVQNIALARNAICDLILGAPPGKVYNKMRNVSKRLVERF